MQLSSRKERYKIPSRIVNGLLNLLYPKYLKCPACKEDFTPDKVFLCKKCIKKIEFIREDYCQNCGKLISQDKEICCDCKEEKRFFNRARAVGVYSKGLKEYIRLLKYNYHRRLAKPLGQLLSIYIKRFYKKSSFDLLTYIPLHERRMEERGFNQAYLLAKEVAEELNLSLKLLLWRKKKTPRQSNLSREERFKNLQGVFEVVGPDLVVGKKILLVDDIYTTGATVNEASKVLINEGAYSVEVITLATGKDFSY